jgi:hypothetical protein
MMVSLASIAVTCVQNSNFFNFLRRTYLNNHNIGPTQVNEVDKFIAANVDRLHDSRQLRALPRLQVPGIWCPGFPGWISFPVFSGKKIKIRQNVPGELFRKNPQTKSHKKIIILREPIFRTFFPAQCQFPRNFRPFSANFRGTGFLCGNIGFEVKG